MTDLTTEQIRALVSEARVNLILRGDKHDDIGDEVYDLCDAVEQLLADKERLDWLVRNSGFGNTPVGSQDVLLVIGDGVPMDDPREAIDAARKQEADNA